MSTFQTLGLPTPLLRSVQDAGYTTPTSIQLQAIPLASRGQDVIGCAQTGTGKTAAFVLPMLARLLETASSQNNDSRNNRRDGRRNDRRSDRPVRALVVTPTRELALQVHESATVYGKHTQLRSLAIYGGVGMKPQLDGLRRGTDIVVATPGRLLDHMDRGTLSLADLDILVLDEADRMLDMGFLRDIKKIVAAAPRERQTLLFSATMPEPIQRLANTIMQRPELIEVGQRRNPAETVTQQVCLINNEQKMDLLYHLLDTEPIDNVLVFSRTKHRADRIKRKLDKRGFSTTVLHSNRSQNQRQRALQGFKEGRFQIMVATDIAARGIDIDSISHVINFDTPNQAEDYIHRIGRTGRARTTGDAITFVTADEDAYLRDIERHTGLKMTRSTFVDAGIEPRSESTPQRGSSNGGGRSSNRRSNNSGGSRYGRGNSNGRNSNGRNSSGRSSSRRSAR